MSVLVEVEFYAGWDEMRAAQKVNGRRIGFKSYQIG
jgi:hypothetical protein